MFQGYFKNPEATRQTLEDGWIHSGDAGFLDQDGHLKIIDRAKDLGRLTDGTMFAPKYLENKLKFSPFVKEAVALGPGRPVRHDARQHRPGGGGELGGAPGDCVHELHRPQPEARGLRPDRSEEVTRVNRSLALEDDVLRGAQIRKFLILHKELDPDDEEITRTRKVRRGYIAQKYAALIEALYGERDRVSVEAEVTYEDGRTGHGPGRRRHPGAEPRGDGDRRDPRPLLEVDDVSVRFGALLALNDVSLSVPRGEIVAIIGPNGAGKTTLLNCISGFYQPSEGRIVFEGRDRTRLSTARRGRARHRAHLPERRPVPRHERARQHHDRAASSRCGAAFSSTRCSGDRPRRQELAHRAFVERIIDFLEIQAIRKTPAGRLPYGLQKRVELARALAAEPQLLLLDEPMAGMNVEEKEDMCRFILDVNSEFGTTIALIEHDMGVVMDISDHVVVLDYGRKIADGTARAGAQGPGRPRRLPGRGPP